MKKIVSAGVATAYGAALQGGFEGTYEQFCELQADFAENAQRVLDASTVAVEAKTAAQSAQSAAETAATNSAGSAAASEQSAVRAETAAASLTVDEDFSQASENPVQNKTITNALTAGKETGTASGSIVTIEDGAEGLPLKALSVTGLSPIQDLHGQDAPYPAGGGKNKLPITLTGGTYYGLTVTVDDNDGIKLTGTTDSTGLLTLYSGDLPSGITPGESYIFSWESAVSTMRLFAYNASNVRTVLANSGSATSVNVTIPSDAVRLSADINVSVSGTTYNVTVKPMIRPASVTDATYAPYSNLCPISGQDSVTAWRSGKNVWNGTIVNGFAPIDNLVVGETYTCTAIPTTPSATYLYIRRGVKGVTPTTDDTPTIAGGQVIAGQTTKAVTFTVEDGYSYYLWANAQSFKNVDQVQLELGSTATDYEPYDGTSVTAQLGQTVYGGTVDVTGGKVPVDRICVSFDGTEIWSKSGSYPGAYYISSANFKAKFGTTFKPNTQFKCSHAKSVTSAAQYVYGTCFCDSFVSIRIMPEDSTLNDWKAYLQAQHSAGTPVQVCCEITEPFTVPLASSPVPTTKKGLNHLWSDAGDISIEYCIDPEKTMGEIAQRYVVATDPTLSVEGDAADAKATGDKLAVLNALLIKETASGAIVSFSDGAAMPAESLAVDFASTQDLHGQDSPYPAGGGKNKCDMFALCSGAVIASEYDRATGTYNADTNILTATSAVDLTGGNVTLKIVPANHIAFEAGSTISVSFTAQNIKLNSTNQTRIRIVLSGGGTMQSNANVTGSRIAWTFTVPEGGGYITEFYFYACYTGTIAVGDVVTFSDLQIEYGSTATDYAPYENICPISGRIGVTVERAGANVFGGDALKADVLANVSKATDASDDAVAVGVQGTGSLSFGAFKANTQYTIILDVLSGGTYLGASFEYTDGTKKTVGSGYTANTRSAKAFTSDANKTIDNIVLSKGAPAYTIYCNTSGIFEGVLTAAEFEPYDGQTAPIYFGGTGKNLYDPDADGYAKIFLPEGTKLTASANSRVTIEYYDSSKTRIDFWSLNQVSGNRYFRSFTLSQDTYYFRFTTPDADCQLELGLTPTDYDEPAVTVYGGTVDAVAGKVHVTHELVDMSTVPWNPYAASTANVGKAYVYLLDISPGFKTPINDPNVRSTAFRYIGAGDINRTSLYDIGNTSAVKAYLYLHLYDGEYHTRAEWQAKLAEMDAKIVLPLAEPFDIDIAPATLSTLKGQNNVWSDADSVEVDYVADPKLYIDKKITAAVAALA